MERLAKAGAAPFGWRLELQDMHQLSQALTLHSLSHCCSFSPLSVSLCPKGQTKKLCQGHSELPGNQGCLPWSSRKEEIRIREQHPHRISPGSGCTKENCSEMRAGGHSPHPGLQQTQILTARAASLEPAQENTRERPLGRSQVSLSGIAGSRTGAEAEAGAGQGLGLSFGSCSSGRCSLPAAQPREGVEQPLSWD